MMLPVASVRTSRLGRELPALVRPSLASQKPPSRRATTPSRSNSPLAWSSVSGTPTGHALGDQRRLPARVDAVEPRLREVGVADRPQAVALPRIAGEAGERHPRDRPPARLVRALDVRVARRVVAPCRASRSSGSGSSVLGQIVGLGRDREQAALGDRADALRPDAGGQHVQEPRSALAERRRRRPRWRARSRRAAACAGRSRRPRVLRARCPCSPRAPAGSARRARSRARSSRRTRTRRCRFELNSVKPREPPSRRRRRRSRPRWRSRTCRRRSSGRRRARGGGRRPCRRARSGPGPAVRAPPRWRRRRAASRCRPGSGGGPSPAPRRRSPGGCSPAA